MSAREFARPYPTVSCDDDALDAVGPLTEHQMPAPYAIGHWPPRRRFRPPFVGSEASALQIAALMSRTPSPLVAVVGRDGERSEVVGAVTAARLVERLIGGS
ncbi:hypothetical protein [Streptomyces sp. NPDC049813]|uniref:hypothetical protein n=1 Tax=Streptomyces sp. NPDC049813 TaxID=3365597 RepID=UPI003791EECA